MPLTLRQERQFEHDCAICVYLGTVVAGKRLADLYVHPHQGVFCMPTVIARYSNEGSDYTSGMCFSYGSNADLTVARIAAEERGIDCYEGQR
jgi:hypothetical protein